MTLNNLSDVSLHRLGLADRDDELTFYLIDKNNYGLGTCSTVEQYDLPLKASGKVKVAAGDSFLDSARIGPIDAIKIDAQGFEPEVFRGLRRVLERDRPFVWLEIAVELNPRSIKIDKVASLAALFPYRSELYRFSSETRGTLSRCATTARRRRDLAVRRLLGCAGERMIPTESGPSKPMRPRRAQPNFEQRTPPSSMPSTHNDENSRSHVNRTSPIDSARSAEQTSRRRLWIDLTLLIPGPNRIAEEEA